MTEANTEVQLSERDRWSGFRLMGRAKAFFIVVDAVFGIWR
jgi:hypothetical protein